MGCSFWGKMSAGAKGAAIGGVVGVALGVVDMIRKKRPRKPREKK